MTQIVERLMQIVPDLRYQTLTEVVSDLRRTLRELGADAPGAELPEAASLPSATGDSELPSSSRNGSPAGTMQFVEHRLEQQDVLRSTASAC